MLPAARTRGPHPLFRRRFCNDAPSRPDVSRAARPVLAAGLAGLRMIRRIMTLCFCAIAFWAGMKLQQMRTADACLDAGGTMRGDDLCTGVVP